MLASVNLYNTKPSLNNSAEKVNRSKINQSAQNIQFGYYNQPPGLLQSLKDGFLMLTDDVIGLTGVNLALFYMQRFVNGKILSGKINKHFTKKINNEAQIKKLADEMLDKYKLKDGAKKVTKYIVNDDQAFYTHVGNQYIKPNSIVYGKNNYSSLFHEIGHAVEENNTFLLKKLQRFRGRYTILSLILYALLSQRPKNTDDDGSIGAKLRKSDIIVPLLAFSPELITEAKASQYGLKFLKQKLNEGVIEKSLYKNIKKSYITCFLTYLFIPVSIILMDVLRNGANNARQRRMLRQNQFYY